LEEYRVHIQSDFENREKKKGKETGLLVLSFGRRQQKHKINAEYAEEVAGRLSS
jgi:hypothetical protein